MSCYLEDRAHIDALVSVAIRGPSGMVVSPDTAWHGVTFDMRDDTTAGPSNYTRAGYDNADEIGRMLWRENLRSVHARYPDTLEGGSIPGPNDFTPDQIDGYVWPMSSARRLTAGEALLAVEGYEYQTCEHPGWMTSGAASFCEGLRRALVMSLPEVRNADTWSIHNAAEVTL